MTDARKAASNAEVGEGDLVEMAAQLRGRAAWYDDARPGSVKTPQLLRQAADLLDGRRAPRVPKEGAPTADLGRAVEAAEAAVYKRHERGFLIKPLVNPIDMRAALKAALPFLPAQAAEPVAVNIGRETMIVGTEDEETFRFIWKGWIKTAM